MSKYSLDELFLAIGQKCVVIYYKDEIKGTIESVKQSLIGLHMITLKTFDNHVKEAFFITRIKTVPFLDEMRKKKLWLLL